MDLKKNYLQEKLERDKRRTFEGGTFSREAWFGYRESLYEPAFINYFNKFFKDGAIAVGKNNAAKYTLDIKTVWIFPGYDMGDGIRSAKLTAILTFKQTANPQNIICLIEFDKVIGLQHEIDDAFYGKRISWAYERLAKNLAIQLKRFL